MANAAGAIYASNHQVFNSRVTKALIKVAADVLAETGVGATHSSRVPFAQQIIAGDTSVINNAVKAIAVLNASSIDIDADNFGLTDAAIENAVSNAWNDLAGVDRGN